MPTQNAKDHRPAVQPAHADDATHTAPGLIAATGRERRSVGNPTGTKHQVHIMWSEAEWIELVKALANRFPELGLPHPSGVARINLRHMAFAITTLPRNRHRTINALTGVRPRLLKACHTLSSPAAAPAPATATPSGPPSVAPPIASAFVPPTIVYRQPDGPDKGPPTESRIYWKEDEWYAVAVELAFNDPACIETLNNLRPAAVFRAQRVLASNRHRPQSGMLTHKIRAELAPAFKRLRNEINAIRRDAVQRDAEAQSAADALREATEAAERAKARDAAEREMRDALLASPDFMKEALGNVALGSLLDALGARIAASAQGIIESALINAFASDRVRNAMVINLTVDVPDARPGAVAGSVTASAMREGGGNVESIVQVKPKVGIIGALSQQGEAIKQAYPMLRIKIIDKNLTGSALRDAVVGCDRVIALADFISHSIAAVCTKALGDKYSRVHGGVSAVRHLLDIWLASGAFQTGEFQQPGAVTTSPAHTGTR